MMSVLPDPATGSALVLGCLVVPFVFVFSHGKLRIDSERNRYLAALGLCTFAWAAWAVVLQVGGVAVSWHDAAAGVLILATAAVGLGILWSLVCWGFTTSLLAALCAAPGAIYREEWFRAYGGGSSVEDFADDRLSVLLGSGMAEAEGSNIILSNPLGRQTAWAVRAIRSFYGLPTHE